MGLFYQAMVEAAAERAVEAGCIDLVSLAEAGEAGFDVSTFKSDVEQQLGDDPSINLID